MGLEQYSPEFGRKWADDPKETLTVTPATQFHIVTQVVMTEFYEQSDDPPGRPPYGKRVTVLAESKSHVPPSQVADRVRSVVGSA